MKQSSVDLSKLTLNDKLDKEETKESNNQNLCDQNNVILIKELGKGGYGYVYDAVYNNDSVIVKCSLTEEKNKYILEEYEYLKILQSGNFRGIPRTYHSFVDNGIQHFVMEKLGNDLGKLRGNKKFSLDTTARVALQVLQILKRVHSCGILHNDIKPDNLMNGLNDPKTIYLIDFGLAKSYMKDGEHISDEFIGKRRGTLSFNSLGALKRRSLSRRDDLESLAYTLIKLKTGKLPWNGIAFDKKMCKKEKLELSIAERNKSAEEICDGTCKEFVDFLNKVRSLKFEQEPDYDGYYEMFKSLLNK